MRHARALSAKQDLQLLTAQFGPIGNIFHMRIPGEFGEHGNRDNQREWILPAARLALIDQGLGLRIERANSKEVGFGGLNERERQCAIVHGTPFWLMVCLTSPS